MLNILDGRRDINSFRSEDVFFSSLDRINVAAKYNTESNVGI